MKTLSFTLLLFTQLCFTSKFYGQNIAINEIGNLPDTSAMLDVSSTTKGFLAPRMTTLQQNAIPSPANGLLIYNTSDNTFKVNKGNAITPEWVPINSGGGTTTNSLTSTANTMKSQVNGVTATGAPIVNSNSLLLTGTKLISTINGVASTPTELSSLTNIAWNLDGNVNTSPATHYLGTRDNRDFIFKTNNIEAMRLTGERRLLGLNVSDPMYRIQVEDPSGPDADIAARMYNANDQRYFPSLQLQVSAGTKAAPLPVTNNTILGGLHFNGFDGAKFNDVISTGILVRATENWNTSSHGSFMIFKTIENGTTAEMERMKIEHNGFIGIGTSTPGSALDIKGVLRLSGSGSGFVGLMPAANAGSTVYTLPAADGSIGQTLTTNGTGTLKWAHANSPLSWGVAGNSGTNPATNFIGTSDANDLVFKTNNIEKLRVVNSTGFTGIGTGTPGSTLDVKGVLRLSGSSSGFVGFAPAPTAGSTVYTLPVADGTAGQTLATNGTGTLSWIHDKSPFSWSTAGNTGTNPATNFIGTSDANDLVFKTNSIEKLRVVNSTGYVGIGTAAPVRPLDLVSNIAALGVIKIQNINTLGYAALDLYSSAGAQVGSVGYGNGAVRYSNALYLATSTTNSVVFGTNNIERIRVDGTTGFVGIKTSAPNSDLHISGSLATSIIKVSANTLLDATHNTVFVTTGTTDKTINLPTAVGITGRIYTIKNIDAGGKKVIIDGNGTQSIDGKITVELSKMETINIQSDGSNWFIISKYNP